MKHLLIAYFQMQSSHLIKPKSNDVYQVNNLKYRIDVVDIPQGRLLSSTTKHCHVLGFNFIAQDQLKHEPHRFFLLFSKIQLH